MIPLCDLTPSRTRPVATLGIAAAQAAIGLAVWSGLPGGSEVTARMGLGPVTWTWPGTAAALLVHPNAYLLAANLAALWLFGGTVEDRLGRIRFLLLWAACGLIAAFAQIAVTPWSTATLLAATGALAGLVGANLALYPGSRILAVVPVLVGFEFTDVPSWLYACVWGSAVLVSTAATPPTGLAAAVAAGLTAGAAAALLLHRPERMRVEWWDDANHSRSRAGVVNGPGA